MNLRRLLAAAGVGLFGMGLVELLGPGLVAVPAGDTLLVGLGSVALFYGLFALAQRRRARPGRVETPDVELAGPSTVPGTDIEATLAGIPGIEGVNRGVGPSLRGTLQKAATVFLTRYRGLDSETAWEQVTGGTWTDDPRAAAFLSRDGQSARDRVRDLVRPGGVTARDRAVDAVAAVAGVDPDGTDPTPGEDIAETGTSDRGRADIAETGTSERGWADIAETDTSDRGRADTAETDTSDRGPADLADSYRRSWHRTHHWTGVSVVVLACLGAGVILGEPGVLLAGVVAVGYVAYARSTPPRTVALSATREVSDTTPAPGDEVTVTVTLTNEGGFCPDLRIVDGVPESLTVADGSPRAAVTLRAGESVTRTYTVTARPGTHEFGPVLVVARTLSNAAEQELLVSAPATLTAVHRSRPVQGPVSLRAQHTGYAGRAPTDTGGEGVAFHSVREYRPGDSLARIDWNRRARTGELTTLDFRRERATRVLVLVDSRPAARVGHSPRCPGALARAVEGAQRVFSSLLRDGHQVGIAAFGPRDCFLPPDTGAGHRQHGRELLATDPAFHARPDPDTDQAWVSRLCRRLSGDTQLLVFSPVLDAEAVRVLRRLEAQGHPVSVVSPDVTTRETPGRRLLCARRRLLLTEVRQRGIPVLDWAPGESLEGLFTRERVTR